MQYHFLVITDGAYYMQNAGWAGTIIQRLLSGNTDVPMEHVLGTVHGCSHSGANETYRAELQAFIECLRVVEQYLQDKNKAIDEVEIEWWCDNDTAVKCANEEITPQSHLDLVALLDYYRQSIPECRIDAYHIRRNEDRMHTDMDMIASSLREIIANYTEQIT